MRTAQSDVPAGTDVTPERHRAPALWLVVLGLVGVLAAAVRSGAFTGLSVLVGVLVAAAVARLAGGGRRPEGVAVRSTWLDVVVLLGLALGITLLMITPGV